jgi:hypothetical protein
VHATSGCSKALQRLMSSHSSWGLFPKCIVLLSGLCSRIIDFYFRVSLCFEILLESMLDHQLSTIVVLIMTFRLVRDQFNAYLT